MTSSEHPQPTVAEEGSDPFDPTGLFAKLSGLQTQGREMSDLLHEVAELAVGQVAGAEDCSITLTSGSSAFSPASAGDFARRLDENQFNLGQGPVPRGRQLRGDAGCRRCRPGRPVAALPGPGDRDRPR